MYWNPHTLMMFAEERYDRLRREVDIRQLCRRYRRGHTLWLQRWSYRALGMLGRALIRVGQRWAAYDLSQRVPIHLVPPSHVQQA